MSFVNTSDVKYSNCENSFEKAASCFFSFSLVLRLSSFIFGLMRDCCSRPSNSRILVSFFIASCFFDVVLWEVFGKEVLRFSNGEFIIQRKGRLYPRSKTIPCFAIEKISIAKMPLSTLNNFGLLFGTKGGHIRIDYFGNEMDGELSHFYFGENVTYEQANKIIRIMERQKKIYDTLINDKILNFNEIKD